MRGLTSLSWRNFGRRRARYALTALGIVLGVGNVFGVLVANSSTNAAVERNATGLFRRGDVSVFPRFDDWEPVESGEQTPPLSEFPAVPDHVVEEVRRLPDVVAISREAVGWMNVTESKQLTGPQPPEFFEEEGRIALAGLDLEILRRIATIEDGRWFEPGAREVVVPRKNADDLNLRIGDEFGAPRGKGSFEVVGIADRSAHDRFGAATSVESMQRLVDHAAIANVQIYLDDSVEPDVWAVRHESRFGDLRFFHTGINREFRRFINVVQTTLGGTAAIAIFVGAFLIYLTFTMAVVERTRMYGTLHALGATAGQVRRVVLVEALGVGIGATLVGLALGGVLSLGLIRLLGRALDLGEVPLSVTPLAVGAALCVGFGATLVGAFVPAARAGRVSPVEAIRVTPAIAPSATRSWIAGVVAIGAGLAVHVLTASADEPAVGPLAGLPILLLLLGAVLLVPPLLPPIVRLTRSAVRRVAPRLGDVAAMHITRERSRSAYTLGLLMVVLAMMFTLGTSHASIGRALSNWVETRFGADVLAYKEGLTAKDVRALMRVDGVGRVSTISFGRTQIVRPREAGVQNVVAIDEESFFGVAGFPWAEGSTDVARRALAEGGSALLPSSTATRFGIDVGDEITVRVADGDRRLTLVGTYASIAAGNEIGLVVGRDDGRQLFGLKRANVAYIDFDRELNTAPSRGEDVEQEFFQLGNRPLGKDALAIREALGGDGFVIEGAQIKAQAEQQLDTYFGLFLAVLLIAVVIGLLGLANTMTTSIVQRFREIGVLQAVGAGPGDLRRMVLAEVGALMGGALVLSALVGLAVSWMFVRSTAALLGFDVEIVYPWGWAPVVVGLAVVVAVVAAIAPSRRAERLTPVEALRYE